MTKGPLIEGILALGPGDSRKMAWGQYHALKKALGDEPVRIVCHYKHGRRKMKSVASALDVQSFTATDAVGSEGERIVKELDRIAKATESLAGNVVMESQRRQDRGLPDPPSWLSPSPPLSPLDFPSKLPRVEGIARK